MANYVCADVATIRNIYGNYNCAKWTEQAEPTPLIPELTKAESNQITLEIIGVMVLVWGWRQIKSMIR